MRVSTAEMRYGRALLAGLGWAGVLGAAAVCVLIFLSAYLAFDGDRPGVRPREPDVVRLPPVPDAKVPTVPLARPSRRPAPGGDGRRGGAAGRAGARGGRRRGTIPRATVPGGRPAPPESGGRPAPPGSRPPAAAPGPPPPATGGGTTRPPPRSPTLGDTTSDVVSVVGTAVGRVSPPAGQVLTRTGERAGDAIDALTRSPR